MLREFTFTDFNGMEVEEDGGRRESAGGGLNIKSSRCATNPRLTGYSRPSHVCGGIIGKVASVFSQPLNCQLPTPGIQRWHLTTDFVILPWKVAASGGWRLLRRLCTGPRAGCAESGGVASVQHCLVSSQCSAHVMTNPSWFSAGWTTLDDSRIDRSLSHHQLP